jgi:hypothetical protein
MRLMMVKSSEKLPSLPPPEAQLLNPALEKIETPLDAHGLVDLPALVQAVKSTVHLEYHWRSNFADVHHLQWPKSAYGSSDNEILAHKFRNLEISKALTPRNFHSWLHAVTLPPPIPDPDIMQYRIDAQRVVMSLFLSVRDARLAIKREADEKILAEQLRQKTDKFFTSREEFLLLPQEFYPFDPNKITNVTSIEDALALGGMLGAFTRPQRVNGVFPAGVIAA